MVTNVVRLPEVSEQRYYLQWCIYMKKYLLYSLLIVLALNCASCLLLADIHTISSSGDRYDTPYNISVDIENSASETIIVTIIVGEGGRNKREVTITTIPMGKIATVNIRKGSTIIITGGNTQRKYLEVVAKIDFERIVVR